MKKQPIFTPLFRGFLTVERHVPTGFEIVRASDSIAVLIAIEDVGVLLVAQKRPAMIDKENPEGFITESIAGRFDKNINQAELAVAEVKEETGVTVASKDVIFINYGVPLALSPGILTERTFLAIVEIPEKALRTKRTRFGNPEEEEGEQTTRVIIPFDKLESMAWKDMKTFALVQCFLRAYERKGATA